MSALDEIIYLDVGQRACRAEVYLNDIPIAYVHKGGRPNAAEAVPEYLVDGNNVLKLVIEPGPIPSLAHGDPTVPPEDREPSKPDMICRTRLARYRDGEDVAPSRGITLAEIEWHAAQEDEPVPLPHVIEKEFDLGTQLGPWAWQTADQVVLDEATYAAAADVVAKIGQAYDAGNPDPIIALARIKHDELQRAYPVYIPGAFDGMFREELTTFCQHEDWQPAPLERSQYDLRTVAGGRMVHAIAKDWSPIVRMAGKKFGYHFMLGHIDGAWHILR